jgi:hypothetical protein
MLSEDKTHHEHQEDNLEHIPSSEQRPVQTPKDEYGWNNEVQVSAVSCHYDRPILSCGMTVPRRGCIDVFIEWVERTLECRSTSSLF